MQRLLQSQMHVRVVGRRNPVVSQRVVHVLADEIAALVPDGVVLRVHIVEKLHTTNGKSLDKLLYFDNYHKNLLQWKEDCESVTM